MKAFDIGKGEDIVGMKDEDWKLYKKMIKDNDDQDEGPNEDETELAQVASKLQDHMGAKDCCLKGYSKKMGVRLGYDVYKLEDEVWKFYELALMSWLPYLVAVAEVSKKRGHVLSYLTMGWSKQLGKQLEDF
ncbi:hypothetical protein Tco_0167591 [Tanacetum coccineum]